MAQVVLPRAFKIKFKNIQIFEISQLILQMARVVLSKASNTILRTLQKFEIRHFGAKVMNNKLWVFLSFFENFLGYLKFFTNGHCIAS